MPLHRSEARRLRVGFARIRLPFAASALFLPALAMAQTTVLEMQRPHEDGETFQPQVFANMRYDSNLFRLADGVQPGGDGRRSAWTRSFGVGLSIDKRYGLQRILVDAAAIRDTYDPYGNLDFTGYRVSSELDWSLTPQLTGKVTFMRTRLPTSFEYVGFQTQPSPRSSKRTRLDVDWRPGAAIHPRFSVFEYEDTSGANVFQLESSRSTSGQVSLVYDFRSTNTAELYARRGHGEYTRNEDNPALLIDSDFDENEYGTRVVVNGEDRSRLDVVVARLQRNNKAFAVRDFQGWVGRVQWDYPITGKTSLRFYAGRNFGASQGAISSYYTLDTINNELRWAATSKITVRAAYNYYHQVFRGSPFEVPVELRETMREKALFLDWSPARAVDVTLRLSHANRAATFQSLQYVDRSASVLARLTF